MYLPYSLITTVRLVRGGATRSPLPLMAGELAPFLRRCGAMDPVSESTDGDHRRLPVHGTRRDAGTAFQTALPRSTHSCRTRQRGGSREERPYSAATQPPCHRGPACAQRGASPLSSLLEGTRAASHCIFPETRPGDPASRRSRGADGSAPEKVLRKTSPYSRGPFHIARTPHRVSATVRPEA